MIELRHLRLPSGAFRLQYRTKVGEAWKDYYIYYNVVIL